MPKRKSVETLKALAIRMIFSSPSLSVFPVRNRLSKLSPQPIFSARSVLGYFMVFHQIGNALPDSTG